MWWCDELPSRLLSPCSMLEWTLGTFLVLRWRREDVYERSYCRTTTLKMSSQREVCARVRACVCVLYFTTALSVSKTYAVLTHGPTSIANWARNSFESFTCSFFKAGHASNRRHDDCYRFHHKMM